jgi:phage terminase large subunit
VAEPIVISLGKKPNPKQIEFFKSRARHTAYGGARGGGKSWAMRTKFVMLAARYSGLQILLLRRTLPELRENHIRPLMELLNGVAQYNEQRTEFIFPNGSRIKCGYCAAEKDVYQFQGQEYDVIGMEEATLFTEAQMEFISTCNRSTRDDFSPRMYYTCNPGGVGHNWVKRLFIDRKYRNSENPDDYAFIQASVFDNKVLMEANPQYVATLENLPDHLRRAHLYGDWDVLAGQFFSEFSRQTHVVDPFEIPDWWQKYRAIDYGLDCAACVWAAFNELGDCYIYREYAEPNKVVSEAAREMVGLTDEHIECTFAPADMWGRSRESGATQAELFAVNGFPLVEVRQGRIDGWLNLAEWMKVIEDGNGKRSRLRIFSTCTELIRCIPQLVHDDKKPSDVSTEPHEITHLPDALRYLMAGRPQAAEMPRAKDEDELDWEDQVDNFLDFGR